MSNIVDLKQVKAKKEREKQQRKLDIEASFTCLERCLKYIEMNNLKELRDLKAMMRKTMRILLDIKNGRRL